MKLLVQPLITHKLTFIGARLALTFFKNFLPIENPWVLLLSIGLFIFIFIFTFPTTNFADSGWAQAYCLIKLVNNFIFLRIKRRANDNPLRYFCLADGDSYSRCHGQLLGQNFPVCDFVFCIFDNVHPPDSSVLTRF